MAFFSISPPFRGKRHQSRDAFSYLQLAKNQVKVGVNNMEKPNIVLLHQKQEGNSPILLRCVTSYGMSA
jgi:hypothetical protein